VSSGTCARLLRQAKAEYASRNDLTRRGGSLLVVDKARYTSNPETEPARPDHL